MGLQMMWKSLASTILTLISKRLWRTLLREFSSAMLGLNGISNTTGCPFLPCRSDGFPGWIRIQFLICFLQRAITAIGELVLSEGEFLADELRRGLGAA